MLHLQHNYLSCEHTLEPVLAGTRLGKFQKRAGETFQSGNRVTPKGQGRMGY